MKTVSYVSNTMYGFGSDTIIAVRSVVGWLLSKLNK